jgi:cytochrome c2
LTHFAPDDQSLKKFSPLGVTVAASISLILACALRLPITAGRAAPPPNQSQPSARKATLIKPKGYSALSISPESEKGQQYYDEAHCSACHSINNDGGIVGPSFDGIGQHRNRDFLYARLADTPEASASYAKLTGQNPEHLAPHLRVSPSMARSLVTYLLTLPEPKGGFAVLPHQLPNVSDVIPSLDQNFRPAPKTAATEEGKKLYEKFGCAQCHQIERAGGFIGPRLDGIGQFRSQNYIEDHITDAQVQAVKNDKFFEIVPTSMPKFTATPEEIRKIKDYLMTLPAN